MAKKIKMYRSISSNEYVRLLLGIPIDGNYNPLHIKECGNNGYYGNIICAFEDEIKWKDNNHKIFITLEVDETKIIGKGESIWFMPKSFSKTKIYYGKRGEEKYILNEYYLKQYSILDVTNVTFLNERDYKNYQLLYSLTSAISYFNFKSTCLELKDYSDKDVITKLEELINIFPDENTFIKKDAYVKALLKLLENSFDFKNKF